MTHAKMRDAFKVTLPKFLRIHMIVDIHHGIVHIRVIIIQRISAGDQSRQTENAIFK